MSSGKSIKWICPVPLRVPGALSRIEAALAVTLPTALKNLIVENNAASPDPQEISLPKGPRVVFERLLSANSDDKENILEMAAMLGKRLPPLTVPFASDPYGNMFCLQYDSNDDPNPRVVFWDHEESLSGKALTAIAVTFDRFLEMLGR